MANDSYGSAGAAVANALTLGSFTIDNLGTIALNADGLRIEYTPASNFTGDDIFTYTITDDNNVTVTATVTVTVEDAIIAAQRPTAVADTYTVSQNSTANVFDVLDNDSFGTQGAVDNGLSLLNGTYTGPSNNGGVFTVDHQTTSNTSDDVIEYTPKAGFVGADGFYYLITDATGDTSITTVTITVEELALPTAMDDSVSVVQDSAAILIDVLANDSFGSDGAAVTNSLTVLSGSSAHGTISVTAGKIQYTPTPGYNGSDTFDYAIEDGSGDTSTATVTVTITALGTGNVPTAFDDAVTVAQDSAENVISILLDNGSGSDSFGTDGPNATHPISLSGSYTDLGGKLELDGNVVKYTPSAGFSSVDSFSYTITDTNGDPDTAIVTVTVTPTTPKIATTTNANILDNEFLVYPNPSNGYVKSTVFSTINTKATLFIFDVTGKILYNLPLQINKGANEFDFNVNVKPGVLFIKITSPEVNFGTSKIIFK